MRLEAKFDQENQELRDSVSGLRDLVTQMRDRTLAIHDLALEQRRVQLGQEIQEVREERAVRDPEVHPEQHPHDDPHDHPQDPHGHFQGPPQDYPQNYPRIPSPQSSQDNLPRKSLSEFPPHPTVSKLQEPVVLHHEPTRESGYRVGQRQVNQNDLDGIRATLEVELRQFLEQDMIRPSLFPNLLMLVAFFLLAQHWL